MIQLRTLIQTRQTCSLIAAFSFKSCFLGMVGWGPTGRVLQGVRRRTCRHRALREEETVCPWVYQFCWESYCFHEALLLQTFRHLCRPCLCPPYRLFQHPGRFCHSSPGKHPFRPFSTLSPSCTECIVVNSYSCRQKHDGHARSRPARSKSCCAWAAAVREQF